MPFARNRQSGFKLNVTELLVQFEDGTTERVPGSLLRFHVDMYAHPDTRNVLMVGCIDWELGFEGKPIRAIALNGSPPTAPNARLIDA